MPKLITDFYAFPLYRNREQYDAQPGDNADAPPWDGTRILQYWVDLNPKRTVSYIGVGRLAIYDAIEMDSHGKPAIGPDGHPVLSEMAIPFEHATSPNFLPRGGVVPTLADLGGGEAARQMQANAQKSQSVPVILPPGSRLRFSPGPFKVVEVYLAGEPLPEEQGPAGQANALADLLRIVKAIASKLGVA
jgi:hypothetical protein